MADMLRAFESALEEGEYSIVESIDLPGRPEQRTNVPGNYCSGAVGQWLTKAFPNGIWSHQAKALDLFDAGMNVVISTGTASGKTLVFQSTALRILDEQSDATVLVFYPLKALVSDQLVSWRRVLAAAGYSENT